MSRIFVGTSGWNYPHWKSVFYPEGVAQRQWLEYYAQVFNCVELNVTFYRLVPKQIFEGWHRRTPSEFRFVVKGSRFITHIKKLKGITEPLHAFADNALVLKEKLAAVLWQLPPSFKKDTARLKSFLVPLKRIGIRQVVEFRHESWFDSQVYGLLEEHNVCLCIAHSSRFPCVKEITADFLYLRFHGGQSLYASNYSDRELQDWASFVSGSKRRDTFALFNNDAHGYAVSNALTFHELLKKKK